MRRPSPLLLLAWVVLLTTARLGVLVHEAEHDPLAGEAETCKLCLLGHGTGHVLADPGHAVLGPTAFPCVAAELPGYRPGFSPLIRPPRAPPSIPAALTV